MSRGSVVTPSSPTWPAKRVAAVLADLAAADRHPADAHLVEHRVPEHARVAGDGVARRGRQRAAEARHQRFLQRAGAERLHLVGVEGAEAGEQLIGAAEPMIEADAELGRGRGPVPRRTERFCSAAAEVGSGTCSQQRRGDRIDAAGGDPIAGKRRARAGRRNGRRIADRPEGREVAAACCQRRHREGARLRAVETRRLRS